MASSPAFKVYDIYGTYQGSCKEPEAAVNLAQWYGVGATVRHHHRTEVWRVTLDNQNSLDEAAEIIIKRLGLWDFT